MKSISMSVGHYCKWFTQFSDIFTKKVLIFFNDYSLFVIELTVTTI